MSLLHRPRRLRRTAALRHAVAETDLARRHMIQPLFVVEDRAMAGAIPSLPGIARETLDDALRTIEKDLAAGIKGFLLFGVPAKKDLTGDNASRDDGDTQRTIRAIKQRFGSDLWLSVDVCLCPHLEHGHCGLVDTHGTILNDASLPILANVAASYAAAGADVIAPSDMMDGRIDALREAMDERGCDETAIMSYAVKYASHYYGPFREAAHSAPAFGDRRTYQMDFRNGREALREAALDLDEGADFVMVKPALAYLDVLRDVADVSDRPVVAYNVSGEYAAVKLLSKAGLANGTDLALENLYAMRRAGADLIISYHARELALAGVLS